MVCVKNILGQSGVTLVKKLNGLAKSGYESKEYLTCTLLFCLVELG